MNSEAREELYQEMKQESHHERMMHEDLEYALQHTDFNEAMELLESVKKALNGYGYEYTLKELAEMW
jgi:6-phosphogluconate dehydrogenase (decarboxylating)